MHAFGALSHLEATLLERLRERERERALSQATPSSKLREPRRALILGLGRGVKEESIPRSALASLPGGEEGLWRAALRAPARAERAAQGAVQFSTTR